MGSPADKPKSAPASPPIDQDGDAEDRPTLVPEFDFDAFARDSESKIRAQGESVSPASGPRRTVSRIRALMKQGSYEHALQLADAMLAMVPLHAEARELASECMAAMELVFLSKLGPLSGCPTLAVSPRDLKDKALDNVSAFLLSRLDGSTSIEGLLDVCGLPRWVALRLLCDLEGRGIIAIKR